MAAIPSAMTHFLTFRRSRVRLLVCLSALLLLAGAGCPARPTKPETFPVTGKVHFTTGQPVSGGLIEFASKTDPQLTVSSPIGTDGSYSLTTLIGNENIPGAVEGEYRVTVYLPMGEDQRGGSVPLPKSYKVERQANVFAIVIAPPKD